MEPFVVSSIKVITYFCVLEKTVNLQENVNPDLLTSMREGVPLALTGIPARKD